MGVSRPRLPIREETSTTTSQSNHTPIPSHSRPINSKLEPETLPWDDFPHSAFATSEPTVGNPRWIPGADLYDMTGTTSMAFDPHMAFLNHGVEYGFRASVPTPIFTSSSLPASIHDELRGLDLEPDSDDEESSIRGLL